MYLSDHIDSSSSVMQRSLLDTKSLAKHHPSLFFEISQREGLFRYFIQEVLRISPNGFFNAHSHCDRAYTYPPVENENILVLAIDPSKSTMREKQNLSEQISYLPEILEKRIRKVCDNSISYKINTIVSCFNIGPKLLQQGLVALNAVNKLKKEYHKRGLKIISLAYPMYGFRNDKPERWKLLEEAIDVADGIATLPERDSVNFYGAGENHIGFKSNIQRTIELVLERKKILQIHLDQQNNPDERGTEILMNIIEFNERIGKHEYLREGEPKVWAVHSVSTSCYDLKRLKTLAKKMAEYNVGLIVCPNAALSMKQLIRHTTPIHNSMAKAIHFMAQGVYTRIGTDNICDMYMPLNTESMVRQIDFLSDALRFYDPEILAYLATGIKPHEEIIAKLNRKYADYLDS